MMRIATLALVLLGLLAWPADKANAVVDFTTGQDVLTQCKRFVGDTPSSDVADAIACGWFVYGVLKGLRWGAFIAAKRIYGTKASAATQQRLMMYCKPEEVTLGQGVRVVVKYLENHPEQLHVESIPLIALAFSEAFPCE